jgi:hypothetical protein
MRYRLLARLTYIAPALRVTPEKVAERRLQISLVVARVATPPFKAGPGGDTHPLVPFAP